MGWGAEHRKPTWGLSTKNQKKQTKSEGLRGNYWGKGWEKAMIVCVGGTQEKGAIVGGKKG